MLGEHREAIRRDVGKTPAHLEDGDDAVVVHTHLTFFQGGHERGVTRQDPEVAFGAGRVDLVNQAREELALRGD